MRLLKYTEGGEIAIVSFDDNDVPPYAILSHTWGADNEEVTFADIDTGYGQAKPGYDKIRFCGEQAQKDGLQYFWIDTCCIDKANKAELAIAIRSMFCWYQNAARCYVYLSDVSSLPLTTRQDQNHSVWHFWIWILPVLSYLLGWLSFTSIQRFLRWQHVSCPPTDDEIVCSKPRSEPMFQRSRWFTRGWTLQELLAPTTVEFFSKEGVKLGDKLSLVGELSKVTGIPRSALQGTPLSDFTLHERIAWSEHRTTKIPADRAYSLMGILGVSLSPIDGETPAEAMKRVTEEVDKWNKCIQDLRASDPRDDKKRIEETKGGLLADSYRWVLDNDIFQQWRQDPDNRLLWVKGDPGKGKTMLLCGIIDELRNSVPSSPILSYFFCQATDSRINSATAVLRGLLYMLVHQQPSLLSHVRKKYDQTGKALFEDLNAWTALTQIFVDVLQDSSLRTTYFIIDALDECITDLRKLLDFVTKQSSASLRVKWIVSSRNWPDIETQLERAGHKEKLSLELNAKSVATAVESFIRQKIDRLAQKNHYKEEVRDAVLDHLTTNANDTFLWAALVCQDLETTANRHVLKKLSLFPPGLDALYAQMMHQMNDSDDAEICRHILASTAVFYRPVAIYELVTLVEELEEFVDDLNSVREIIGFCRSFLTLRADTVYFIHQSAQDFLLKQAYDKIFLRGDKHVHQAMFSKSLAIMSRSLCRDMYNLTSSDGIAALGLPIQSFESPDPDPLMALRYPCVYWIDHFCELGPEFGQDNVNKQRVQEELIKFFKEKYLYWLEGLSLCKSMEKGVVSMTKLWAFVQELRCESELAQLVQDAWRFIMHNKGPIQAYPLQTYASALLFSPTGSLTRSLFRHEEPKEITIKPALSQSWSACLQTLEGHSDWVRSVAFSHDSARLASASDDSTVKIWDAHSGACLQTLEGRNGSDLLSILATQRCNENIDESQRSLHHDFSISVDTIWVSINSQNVLWLPSEYRPNCSAVLGKSIGVGTGHGKVWIGRVE